MPPQGVLLCVRGTRQNIFQEHVPSAAIMHSCRFWPIQRKAGNDCTLETLPPGVIRGAAGIHVVSCWTFRPMGAGTSRKHVGACIACAYTPNGHTTVRTHTDTQSTVNYVTFGTRFVMRRHSLRNIHRRGSRDGLLRH